jgi:hypothetical protein
MSTHSQRVSRTLKVLVLIRERTQIREPLLERLNVTAPIFGLLGGTGKAGENVAKSPFCCIPGPLLEFRNFFGFGRHSALSSRVARPS